jgi:hypothetical protein
MRFSTVDEDAARTALAAKAAAARKIQESIAIHSALGPVAIETRLKELDREIVTHKAGREPHVALLLGTFGHDGPTSRRPFLFSIAGAAVLAWFGAPRRPDSFRPRELHMMHEIERERKALLKLKHELS